MGHSSRLRLVDWEGLEFLVRPHTVDLKNLSWMKDSTFWRAFIAAKIQPDENVFDLGAHIGSFGLRATAHSECKVFGVEPHHDSFRLYSANALINNLQDKQVIVNGAVGGKDGTVVLYEHAMNWAHTTQEGASDPAYLTGVRTEVACWSLGSCFDLAQMKDCAFMKMNVEGAEFEFIENAVISDLRRIRTIVAELHFDRAKGSSKNSFIERLRSADFEVRLEPLSENRAMMFTSRT